jgi:hypothetical protein
MARDLQGPKARLCEARQGIQTGGGAALLALRADVNEWERTGEEESWRCVGCEGVVGVCAGDSEGGAVELQAWGV